MLGALPRTAGAATFKQGMRALVGGVTVIATQDAMGVYLGLTATSVTSLSANPPSILLCVNRSSPMAEALRTGVLFSANVLAANQVDVAQAFGGQRTVRGMGRFAYGSWFRSSHDVPLLGGARVNLECVAAESMDWATHKVVISRVCDIHFTHPAAKPLVYHDGRYTTVE
jgi:flavin reductase (DIM6/NTAB) family NADH-FMN oxidoreductase RutF